MEIEDKYHLPVMGSEAIEWLVTDPSGIYIDGTCGTGGHTGLIIGKLAREGTVIACELNPRILEIAGRRLKGVAANVQFHNCGYHQISALLTSPERLIDGYLLDLGICSVQLEESYGFAFKSDNPLDMRFDPKTELTAADIINNYSRDQLKQIFKSHGELKQAAILADKIIDARRKSRIETTFQLKDIILPIFPRDRFFKGLAQVAQALRITVNNELENLAKGLVSLTRLLKTGGRLVVISYHSLEDRIVKNFIRTNSRATGYPPEVEEALEQREFKLVPLTRRAITPSLLELELNPQARSAKLRAAARV